MTKRESVCSLVAIERDKQAFDRIDQEILFSKLSQHGAPQCFMAVLLKWYSRLKSCVRWNEVLSEKFRVICGVCQSSILSPFMFNVYVDEYDTMHYIYVRPKADE